jgi:3-phenylpropionate/trans-cinnamate dioxygenase ferredoxin subunit
MFNYTQLQESEVNFIEIGPADLANGERLFVEIGDRPIVVFNIAGTYYAIGDVCTHDNGPLGDGDLEDFNVVCPRHGATFDARSGQATGMPAAVDIPSYPVRVVGGMLEIGIPKN